MGFESRPIDDVHHGDLWACVQTDTNIDIDFHAESILNTCIIREWYTRIRSANKLGN